jgi:hypothetical protein
VSKIRASSVAIITRATVCAANARSATHKISGLPAIFNKGLPGRRLEL